MYNRRNLILCVDSYKLGHYLQMPPNTDGLFSYIEARIGNFDFDGNRYDKTLFFGLQAFIKEYLLNPINQEDIDEAEVFAKAHGEPFNKEGWQRILKVHNGFIPVKIRAVPEGMLIPRGNVLVTVESTDPLCYWVVNYIETALLRGVWYPTTVATVSFKCKEIIKKFLDMTSDDTAGQIGFKLHDFGARGAAAGESAMLGGMAHLVNFMGTDTIEGIIGARRYYETDAMVGFSIPAAEHSTITSWGRENEAEAYRNMLRQFGKPGALLAVVSDSYDIYNAADKIWGQELKQEVIDSGAIVVVRPDSGNPVVVDVRLAEILAERFGFTVNTKGYKVLNNVRIIQGDGVNPQTIQDVLNALANAGFAADNIAFGMGGALLQRVNRDTFNFAMKTSAVRINGVWQNVHKEPVTEGKKLSKAGKISLYKKNDGTFVTAVPNNFEEFVTEMMDNAYVKTAFDEKPVVVRTTTFEMIRNLAGKQLA